jgi:predicted transcriptional regulator of viral defense system
MRTSQLRKAGIYYAGIQKLLAEGVIEKVSHGIYLLTDGENTSDIVIINRLFPETIMCLETALFYYGYSDRVPSAWHLAVDKDTRKTKFNIDYPFVKPYYLEPQSLEIGVVSGEIDGHGVRIYDKERTICDCLKRSGRMDKEIFNKAIQAYVKDPKKNIPNLMQYAKRLRVEKKVKDLIGVWL